MPTFQPDRFPPFRRYLVAIRSESDRPALAIRRHDVTFLFMARHDHRFGNDMPPNEAGEMLLFDSSGALCHRIAFAGEPDHLAPPWRHIVGEALQRDCATLVLFHSHPSGDPRPSATDIVTTRRLCRMLRPLRLRLADHIILAGSHRFSFRGNGLL